MSAPAVSVRPEQPAETERQVPQGGVVEHRLAFLQLGDQDVADRAAGDAVAVDQLGWAVVGPASPSGVDLSAGPASSGARPLAGS